MSENLNDGISIMEVKKAVSMLNRNRDLGQDQIPAEVLRSDACIFFLHRVFCVCFETGKVPQAWSFGIINPIQKYSTTDSSEQGNYRGIFYNKKYCSILNTRHSVGAEHHRVSRWLQETP